MKKGLITALCVICGIVIVCAVAYKPAYNYIAPKIFDYVVEDNLDKLISVDDIEKSVEKNLEKNENVEKKSDDLKEPSETNAEPEKKEDEKVGENKGEIKSKSKASANSPLNENNENGIYKSKTSAGVFDENDLSSIAKRLTPADKTQIISIVQSCISAGDYPDLARRAKNLNHENMAYLESYLRSHMSASAKQQILNIVTKYK